MEIYEIAVFNYLHCWAAGLLRFYVWISRRLNSFLGLWMEMIVEVDVSTSG